MTHPPTASVALAGQVREILDHALDHEWRMQDIGVLARWLDDAHTYRLHVWDPESAIGDPPVHDHPFDFTSTVIVGELVNTRYREDPHGDEYVRERYVPGREDHRRVDAVRLVGTPATLRAGVTYRQLAHELHDSRQSTGTVTVMHFDRFPDDVGELSVCRRPDTPRVGSGARTATPEEVARITSAALARFELTP
jgi:hypothetical protein